MNDLSDFDEPLTIRACAGVGQARGVRAEAPRAWKLEDARGAPRGRLAVARISLDATTSSSNGHLTTLTKARFR